MSPVDKIKIRMYDTGSVGDCILLLFEKDSEVTFRMLIDCGGYNTNAAAVIPCVEDIKVKCDNKLDLLVVTHQHEDHISGFNLARAVFDEIEVDKVWMSWVEDKSDPIAKELKKKYGKKLKEVKGAIEEAVAEIRRLRPRSKSAVKGADNTYEARKLNLGMAAELLKFEEGRIHDKKLGVGKRTNDDAMEYVRKKGNSIQYKKPGQVEVLKGAEGVKFYILGPPRDKELKYLKIEMNESEMYHFAAADSKADSDGSDEYFLQSGISLRKKVSPFGDEFQLSKEEEKEFKKEYNSNDYRWRQIETDWLETGNELALALTRLTNNTSLAIAIEIDGSGKVILLPGDAQSGNWMSWHKPETSKKLKDKGGKGTVELLNNTVFYKVGHHLSHNGTASVSGLENMTHDDLIAFAPLVQAKVPLVWGGSENFPAKGLNKVIIQKTKGRLVRTDIGLVDDHNAKTLRENLSASDQAKLKKALKKEPLCHVYTVER